MSDRVSTDFVVTAMAKQGSTRQVSPAQVRSYLAKAEEYAAAAASEMEAQRGIAATSLAIHAGINAADAVCGPGSANTPRAKTTPKS